MADLLETFNRLTAHALRRAFRRDQIRMLPLEFLEWDGVLHLFATKSGAPTNPSWYYNLLANPDVTVEHGRETFAARARLLEADERDRMWRRLVELKPRFAEYEQKTDRAFPVFALDRA